MALWAVSSVGLGDFDKIILIVLTYNPVKEGNSILILLLAKWGYIGYDLLPLSTKRL